MKESNSDRAFNLLINIIVIFLLILFIYPLYFIVIASFSNPDLTNQGKVWIVPRGLNFDGYKALFEDRRLWVGYRNTILYTVSGTLINLMCTLPAAYALSRKRFLGKKVIYNFILFTMFFSGGLIPTYLLVKQLGMRDTIWAMILPNAISVWNLIITKTNFSQTIPDELADAAFIDGCSHFRFFISVVLPLSKVIIIVIALFYAVGHWNGFFQALIYINDQEKIPLQLFLRDILIQQQNISVSPEVADSLRYTANLVQYAMIVVSSAPIIILYTFLQKYFVKGVMIGSIKG